MNALQFTNRSFRFFCLLGVLVAASPSWVCGQEEAESLDELRKRIQQLEVELQRMKISSGQGVSLDPKNQRVLLLVESPFLGSLGYSSNGQNRFLAAKLIMVNLTDTAVTVPRNKIHLLADSEKSVLEDVPENYRSRTFRHNNQTFYLSNMRPVTELTARPGGTASTWVFFTKLPTSSDVPPMQLLVNIGEKEHEVDINQAAADQLALKISRVGPRQLLGLITVDGQLDTINIGTLIKTLETFGQQRVVRVVLHFGDSASPIDSNIQTWLTQVANAGPNQTIENPNFPAIPTSIREFHVASFPSQSSSSRTYKSSSTTVTRIHPTLEDATTAALEGVYERLPIAELLDEIENGSRMSQIVALTVGGGRLPASQLRVLLKFADSEDPQIQQAALKALSHFGEPEAIDKLVFYIRKNVAPVSEVATASLASSRFNKAHEALLEILKNEPTDSKKQIVKVLAKYPRPIWSETIYEFAADAGSGITADALSALMKVGHPKLYDALAAALHQKPNADLRNSTFTLLVNAHTAEADKLALDHTINELKTSPPNSSMVSLLKRTKDQRAVPLLIEHLKRGGSARSGVIDCLVQIGDQRVIDLFVEKYSSFETHEQSTVLNALQQMRSPRFRELARQALLSNNSSLISSACRGLQADGSDDAVEMLAQALEMTSNTSTLSYVSNALGQLGTARAREALNVARRSGNSTKSRYAQNALRSIQQRSPGYQYVYHARKLENEEEWEHALEMYDSAIKADNSLPEAFAGRAHVQMKQKKFKAALTDFDKALKLDDQNALAVTGKALTQVLQGEYEAGIETVNKADNVLKRDSLYAYNRACVYGRALEYVKEHEDEPDRELKLKSYETAALDSLEKALQLGFNQKDLIAKDPDLNSIRDTDRYKQILNPKPKTKTGKPPAATRARPRL